MILDNVVHGEPTLKIHAHASFGRYVLDQLRAQDKDAVILYNANKGVKTTNRQLLQDIVDIASGLKELGVKRGDVVAICSENRVEVMTAALGIICCGATVTMISTLYTKDEMTHALNISKPKMVLFTEDALNKNLNTLKNLTYINKIVQLNGTVLENGILYYNSIKIETDVNEYKPADVVGWSDTALILYSSGTTGLPKGVRITHANILYAIAINNTGHTFSTCKRLLTLLPWSHAYGLLTSIAHFTENKLVVFFSGFQPEQYLTAIQVHNIDVIITVPPTLVFLANSALVGKFDLSSIRLVFTAAAPLRLDIIKEVMKCLPNCKGILQGYGMTETTLLVLRELDGEVVECKPGTVGYPLPGIQAKVVDIETQKLLGPLQEGEICLKGPTLCMGYVDNIAATNDLFDNDGYLKTGDYGYYDADGSFFIVNRFKELIKYKGYQVPPALVESVLLQHSGVAECGVAGAPDEAAGELPTAFVVPKPGAKLTERELLQFTDDRLSPITRLRGGIIFVDEIPKTALGKISRHILKKRLEKQCRMLYESYMNMLWGERVIMLIPSKGKIFQPGGCHAWGTAAPTVLVGNLCIYCNALENSSGAI